MRFVLRVLYDAIMRFSEDDGWAIASHIALSILTSLFPFLIFVTALAGFFGSKSLADDVAHLLLQTWPQQVAAPIANEIHDVLTQTTASRLPPDRPRLNLKASLDPSGRNQDSAIALLEMGHRDS